MSEQTVTVEYDDVKFVCEVDVGLGVQATPNHEADPEWAELISVMVGGVDISEFLRVKAPTAWKWIEDSAYDVAVNQ